MRPSGCSLFLAMNIMQPKFCTSIVLRVSYVYAIPSVISVTSKVIHEKMTPVQFVVAIAI